MPATPWARLYGTERWRRRTALQLKQFPMCAQCERDGKAYAAQLSHHVHPYSERSTELDFWFGPLESLCTDCHRLVHGKGALKGYETDINPVTGWPDDPMHPANQNRSY